MGCLVPGTVFKEFMIQQNQKIEIRAVLFDFDGTLRHNEPLAHHFFFDHAVALGAVDSARNRRQALHWSHQYWKGDGDVVADAERYVFDTPAFWLNYAHRYLLAFNCSPEQAETLAPELTRHMHEDYAPVHQADPDAHATLQALRDAGLVVGVVSNRDQPYTRLLETLDLAPLFDFSLAAGEVQSWKPDPQIFLHALERSGTLPGETVYVGDNYFADVVGARRAGLLPVLYDREGVFPEADCPVIETLAALQPLISMRSAGIA